MKLSCLPVSLYSDFAAGRRTLRDWFAFAAELGLDGADLSVAHITSREPAYLRQVRADAAAAGVEIVMLAAYTDWTHPDAVFRAAQTADLGRWVEVAAALGAPFIRVVAGQDRPGLGPEAYDWVVEGLISSLSIGKTAGVQLLYENHVRGAVWTANDWTQPAERFLEVVRRTQDSDLKVLFDTANCLAIGDDPAQVLDAVINRVGAVHVSDIARLGTFEPTTIGTGVTPIPQLLHTLVAAGWDGWLSIEEGSRTGEQGFRTAVPYVRQAWQEAVQTTGN